MGCDIHTVAERQKPDGSWAPVAGKFCELECNEGPFGWRSYAMFGFLAGVRGGEIITPISEPRGLPDDCSAAASNYLYDHGDHSWSWLSVAELVAYDYDSVRYTYWDKEETLRDILGERYFRDLAELQRIGAERIVFGFDS